MHNKITKAVTASLMAAAMLTTTVATIAPMSVSAGQVLGENDFTYKALPWHTCETNPAKQTFELTEHSMLLLKNQAVQQLAVNPDGIFSSDTEI